MNIIFRQAKKDESDRLAELDSIAGGGAIEYLFHGLVSNMSPIELVASIFYNDTYPHTYRNAIVAEHSGHIVGMSLSFPGSFHKITDGMLNLFPHERIEHFREFFSAPVGNDYFVDAISVEDQFRRKGIGEKLIELTEQKAIKENYDSLSLLVWKDNINAISFYKKVGFIINGTVDLQYHELMPHEGGSLLMKKYINISKNQPLNTIPICSVSPH